MAEKVDDWIDGWTDECGDETAGEGEKGRDAV